MQSAPRLSWKNEIWASRTVITQRTNLGILGSGKFSFPTASSPKIQTNSKLFAGDALIIAHDMNYSSRLQLFVRELYWDLWNGVSLAQKAVRMNVVVWEVVLGVTGILPSDFGCVSWNSSSHLCWQLVSVPDTAVYVTGFPSWSRFWPVPLSVVSHFRCIQNYGWSSTAIQKLGSLA